MTPETNALIPVGIAALCFLLAFLYGRHRRALALRRRVAESFGQTPAEPERPRAMTRELPLDKAVETPDFFDMNIKLAYEFPLYKELKLEVNGGVQNLFNAYQSDFDQGKNRDSSYIYGPASPRSYFAGVKMSF